MKAGGAVHSALWSPSVCHLKGVLGKWLMQVGRLPARGTLETYKGLFRGAPASQSSFNTPRWGKQSRNEGFKPADSWPCHRPQVSPSSTPASETLRWGWRFQHSQEGRNMEQEASAPLKSPE